jgi:hypothetical protein
MGNASTGALKARMDWRGATRRDQPGVSSGYQSVADRARAKQHRTDQQVLLRTRVLAQEKTMERVAHR